MTATMTLTDFLLARIADDEGVAQLSRPHEYLSTRDDRELGWQQQNGYAFVTATSGRILAECEAKRRIVELLTNHYAVSGPTPWERMAEANRDVLRHLALPYAGHPDYQPEWRP